MTNMEHLVKLLRDSYDLQEEKSEETAYWHLQKLRSEIKQLALTDVSQQRELLIAFHKWQQSMWTSPNAEITENVVDVYLKSN